MDVNTTIVLVSFSIYTAIIIGVGLYSNRYARRSDEDYFLAGRSLNKWLAGLSASASSESGWVTLGLVGWAFTEGVKAYWILPGCLLGFIFNWFVIARRMRRRARDVDAVTVPDFFAFHFRERYPIIRSLAVLVILVAMFLYVAAQFAAAGKAVAATFDVDYRVGVLLGGVIVLIYTVSGGFRAVCWTDFLQALLMVLTLVVFPLYLIFTAGGYGFIAESFRQGADTQNLLVFIPEVGGIAFIGFLLGAGALGINFGYPGQPHVLVRFMALRDDSEAVGGGIIAVIWGAMVYWGAVTVGLFARAFTIQGDTWARPMTENPDIYGELGLVLAAMNLLPAILSGLVLAAILAAICSTADSQLLVAASAGANDLYSRLVQSARGKSHMLVNRLVVFVLGLGAMLAVLNQEVRVYKFVLTYGWAILGAAFGPQIVLTLWWKRATYAGSVAGMATGFLAAILWKQLYNADETGIEIYNLPIAFVLALAVNVVVSLLTAGTPEAGEA